MTMKTSKIGPSIPTTEGFNGKQIDRKVLSCRSINVTMLLIIVLVVWIVLGKILSGGKAPESLELNRDKPMQVNWGGLAEMDVDVLIQRMTNSVADRDGNSFIKTVQREPSVFRPHTSKSIDSMKAGTCVILTPTKGENSPYGVCKHGPAEFSVISWIRLKYAENMGSPAWQSHVLLTPNTKYISTASGGRVSVIQSDMGKSLPTKTGRKNMLSGCGYPKPSDCVEKTPDKCIVQTSFMNMAKGLKFQRDRYFWCEKHQKFVGMEMHRHKFGYFNKVFQNIYMDLPAIDVEIHGDKLIIFRDKGLALEVVNENGKLVVYFQLLFIIFPYWFASTRTVQRTASKHPATGTFMDICYRLNSLNFIFIQMLYFSYYDQFLIAYGVAHFNSLGLSTVLVVFQAVVNSLLVIMIGTNVFLKVGNANFRFDFINKHMGTGNFVVVILLSVMTLAYYWAPSVDKGTLCSFKYTSTCVNGGTCCSPTFLVSVGHVILYVCAMLVLLFSVVYTTIYRKKRRTMSSKLPQNSLTWFERKCIHGSICMAIQDYSNTQACVIVDGSRYVSALAVCWVGFIGVENLGLIRVKDLYLIIFAFLAPMSMLEQLNVSVVVWRTTGENFSKYHVNNVLRLYLWGIKSYLGSSIMFYVNDIGDDLKASKSKTSRNSKSKPKPKPEMLSPKPKNRKP